MSKSIPAETFNYLMPCFQQAFEAVDELKEAAILVIGAISDEDGCLA